ncbi:malto-oligosyltrehalose synthase [Nostocaceae cyanobacterium CENA369]|uniref:Malto-oligosyltrehalose synthase n=1 Tax=Dendronalium phyllosphericum CENA369 TaxID=1725256 RepID=A0A8J7LFH8_9NOST|nr:malto-oligosyltrehalose synthase [Dendronalium phyllosphericum]MBH8575231.1 malto-oligosyltrehalose synthase [Dendronalium phyllosphericum CENA369]
MRIPTATYRIQFTPQFGFENAQAIAAYLADLGISDLYASPIFWARSGSTHGYDVVDAAQLNPELGTTEAFEALVSKLQSLGMGWLQDIVPNHMAYSSENHYLMDILEHGPDSDYTDYFDLSWNVPFGDRQERILAPLLGDFYGVSLEKGDIQLQYSQTGLTVNYYSLKLPLRLESYTKFLTYNLGKITRTLGRNHPDFIKLLGILYILKNVPSEVVGKQRQDQIAFIKGLIWELYNTNDAIHEFIEENLKIFNGEPGNSDSFNLLDELLREQFYRLSFWKVGAEEMNYRRFFTVNELISVKVEEMRVFNNTHSLIHQLVAEGKFTGLRIDHIDGLYNPLQYLERLRENMGDVYITVEKILELTEDLPENWDIQGTSGYDFLNYVNGVFCQTENQSAFDKIYHAFINSSVSYASLVKEKKHLILEKNLAGDIDNLSVLLKNISSKYRYGNDFTLNGLKRAIAEVLTLFPIYRTYITADGISDSDRACIQEVIRQAREQTPLLQNELTFIEKLMLLEFDDSLTQTEREQWIYFVLRMQQYSGPLMAKGVEDTTLYVYNRLLSLNEVGGNPSHFGISAAEFHTFNRKHQANWPHTMNGTATHDTKRGEDLRARINVLSELPQEWEQQVNTWSYLNQDRRSDRHGFAMPDRNDEYFLYQTLVGAFPFDDREQSSLVERVKDYMIKAIREAKVHTAWLRPDSEYEEACASFIDKILDPSISEQFLAAFRPFQERIAYYGMFNSLSQTLLKTIAPGVPDFYQGTELWELSLVDPDNRRPVDFEQRRAYLSAIREQIETDILKLIQELLNDKTDGRIKLFLTAQLLKARTDYLSLFQEGDYLPLEIKGTHADRILAFARRQGDRTAIAIAPRFLTSLIQPGENPLGESVWQDTHLQLPSGTSSAWKNVLTEQLLKTTGTLPIGAALADFPVALLVSAE